MYVYPPYMNWACSALGDQKRVLSSLELELQVVASHPRGCLKFSLGSLQEQQLLLTTKVPLRLHWAFF